eukprot:COSAG06_NODE_3637_length_5065_cov_7.899780_10_plen_136_part_00
MGLGLTPTGHETPSSGSFSHVIAVGLMQNLISSFFLSFFTGRRTSAAVRREGLTITGRVSAVWMNADAGIGFRPLFLLYVWWDLRDVRRPLINGPLGRVSHAGAAATRGKCHASSIATVPVVACESVWRHVHVTI